MPGGKTTGRALFYYLRFGRIIVSCWFVSPERSAPMSSPDVLLTEEQIRNRVTEMAGQISEQVETGGRPLYVIAILDNGFMFMCDLVRHMNVPVVCQFLKLETRDLLEEGHHRRQILH